MKKFINEGEVMPKGYGVCYQEMHRLSAVIAPIPFNFIIAFAKWFEWTLIRNPFAPRPKKCLRCYQEGVSDGERKKEREFMDERIRFVSLLEKLIK